MEVCSHYRHGILGLTLLLVGMIERQIEFSAGTLSDDTLEFAPPVPSFTHSRTERETANRVTLSEPSPPLHRGHAGSSRTTAGGTDCNITDGYKGSDGQRRNKSDHQSLDVVSSILTPPPSLTPPPRSPLRPKLSRDRNRLKPYSPAVTPSPQVVDLGLSSTPPNDLHMRRPRLLAPKVGRSVVSSVLTDTTTYSSLLDSHRGGVGGGRFGTVRTVNTEATSYLDSGSPSGGDYKAPGSQDRKPGESAIVDLTRVPGETEGGMVSRIRPRESFNGEDGHIRVLNAPRLGKGKWPDDFFPHNSLSPGNELSGNPTIPTPLSTTPPRRSAIVGRANGSTESLSQSPRRPSHRSKYSLDAPPSLLPRDVSPGGRTALSTSKIIVPRRITQSRSPGLLGRSSMEDERRSAFDARVPFPRAVSATRGQLRRDEGTSDPALVTEVDKPWVTGRSMIVRGRTQSEIDSSSSKRKSRPISSDLSGRNPRRSRFESMVNLGAATDTVNASNLLNRNAQGDNKVRPLLIVKEEGKSATQFVSTFSSPSSSLFPFRLRKPWLVCPFIH